MTAKKKKKSTAVVPATSQEVALPHSYGDDAGVGMDFSMDDLLIPFVSLLQTDSKQCVKQGEDYIEGAEAGMIANTATKELFGAEEGMLLVPAKRRRTFVEWAPNRGGFIAEHEPGSPIVRQALASGAKKSELKTDAGNDLQETFSIWGIIVDADRVPQGFCVVPCTSSKIKPYRAYWTRIDSAKITKSAPIFANVLRLSSRFVPDHPSGKKFFTYVLTPAGDSVVGSLLDPTSQAYIVAKELREAINQGRAKADQSTNVREVGGGGTDEHF